MLTKKEVNQLKKRVMPAEYIKMSRMELMELIGTLEQAVELLKTHSDESLKIWGTTPDWMSEEAQRFISQYEKEN